MLDDTAPAIRERLPQRSTLPFQHRLAQRGDGEAGQQHHDGHRQGDHDQGRDPQPDSDEGNGDEQGGDQPTPPGELDPFTGEAEQGREQGE